jgi:phospholipase C
MSGPGWPKTLLIWLYDEHGGYYDHVPPPPAPAPDNVPGTSVPERFPLLRRIGFLRRDIEKYDKEDAGPRTYDRYGFRVPAVIVSPYAKRDYVTDTVFDHTSILKLIEQKWNLPSLTLRDRAATAPLDALDFSSPPAFLVPPKLAAPSKAFRRASLGKS